MIFIVPKPNCVLSWMEQGITHLTVHNMTGNALIICLMNMALKPYDLKIETYIIILKVF